MITIEYKVGDGGKDTIHSYMNAGEAWADIARCLEDSFIVPKVEADRLAAHPEQVTGFTRFEDQLEYVNHHVSHLPLRFDAVVYENQTQ